MIDTRLLGTWKSDLRMTSLEAGRRCRIPLAKRRKFKLLFGKLRLRFTRTRICRDFGRDRNVLDIDDQFMFGPAIQYAAEKNADPIRLRVYTGDDGRFTLYEDENVNYNYEKGAFSTIEFTYDAEAKSLRIGARQGQFLGMLQSRTFEVVWVSRNDPSTLDLDGAPAQTVRCDGKQIVVRQP